MLVKNSFEVAQSVDKVWAFFEDIPQVAACLPGAELTDDLGGDKYLGRVRIAMGPVRLQFAGTAEIKERNDATKRLVASASGADERGRGQASMQVVANLAPTRDGTKVDVGLDLELSGAAAQFGRGMVSDVTAVLMQQFATSMQARIDAIAKGISPDQVGAARSASGIAIALRALRMALARVARRFFLPYRPISS